MAEQNDPYCGQKPFNGHLALPWCDAGGSVATSTPPATERGDHANMERQAEIARIILNERRALFSGKKDKP